MTLSDELGESPLELTIKCADCESSLVEMVKFDDSDKIQEIKAHCSVKGCGGESWVKKLKGEYRLRPYGGRSITDMEYSEDGVSLLYVS